MLKTICGVMLFFACVFPVISFGQQTHTYTAVKITDGDTFVASDGNIKFKLRIVGMDAPERDQPYGKVAKKVLENLLANKNIQITPVGNGLDIYGRSLGQIFVDGKDVALQMIEQGYASYYRPKCQDYPSNSDLYNYDPRAYVEAEKMAKSKKLNIWTLNNFELPCEFRKTK